MASFPGSRDCESIIQIRLKTFFTTKARRTRSFQCIELKRLFFLRVLRVFVVNSFLIPTRRVGMPSRRAAPRVTGNVAYTGRSASNPAFPRSTWERGVLEHLCMKTRTPAWELWPDGVCNPVLNVRRMKLWQSLSKTVGAGVTYGS